MKKHLIRIISLALVLLMILPLVISCGNRDNTPANSESNGNNDSEERRDSLPELDYGGEDVNFLSHGYEIFYNETTVDSGDNSDIVDAAVWRREMKVEDRLNINIVNTRKGEAANEYDIVPDEFRSEILAGTNNYDIGVNNMTHALQYAAEGLYYDLYKIPNIDLSKSYYSQGLVDSATIGGKLFGIAGDATLTYIKYVHSTFFNRTMAEELKIPDLYQIVLDGDWTLEKQISLSKDVYTDVDGGGKKDLGDVFGFIVHEGSGVDSYGSAFELPILIKDAEGKMKFAVNVDKTVNMLKTVNQFFYQTQGVMVVPGSAKPNGETAMVQMFANDQALFMTHYLSRCETQEIRNMESLYGILPIPKYDDAQQQYHAYVHDLMSIYLVSAAVPESRLAMVGATIECMFSESEECRHKLFEEALKVKYQSTEKTGRMLDIMIDNVVIDSGLVFACATNKFGFYLRDMNKKRTTSVAGYWRMNQTSFEKMIGEYESTIKELK